MASKKTKESTWLVQFVPPKGEAPKLKIRPGDTGAKRTAVRNYHLSAPTRAEAQSIGEQMERAAADQQGVKPWKVDSVTKD